jgi:hypothetical protein
MPLKIQEKVRRLGRSIPMEARPPSPRTQMLGKALKAKVKPAGPTAFQKFAMKPSVGKILDSGIARKAAIPLGNAVIKGVKKAGSIAAKPFKWAGGQIEKEMKMDKAKDDEYRRQGENMMKGREEYKPSARRGRSTSDGRMV